jgi:protein-disulfide isomerase
MMIRRILITLASAALVVLAQAPAPKTAAAPAAATPKKSALNKADLEAYLRHLYVWPPPIVVTIQDPSGAPMPGYYEVKVRGVSGAQMQDETFFVSFDGQKIIRGVVYDVSQNPFKNENEKIKTSGRPGLGTAGAPVVIAEFSDFQCPFCREEAKTIRENLLKSYPKEARLYFFDYPLEQIHPWAKPAAIAGRCVFKQSASAFWDFHDFAFEHQAELTADNLQAKVLDFAKGVKDLNVDDLKGCMVSKATESEVNASIAIGQSLGVNQTPTVFVNGRRLGGVTNWTDLKFVIDYEIGYQKTAKNAGEDCGCDVTLPSFGGTDKPAAPGKLK